MPELLFGVSPDVERAAVLSARDMAEAVSGSSPREVVILRPDHDEIGGDVRKFLVVRQVARNSPVFEVISNTRNRPPGRLNISIEELMRFFAFCSSLTSDRLEHGVVSVATSLAGLTHMFTANRDQWFGIQPVSPLISGRHVSPDPLCFSNPEIEQLMRLRWSVQAPNPRHKQQAMLL